MSIKNQQPVNKKEKSSQSVKIERFGERVKTAFNNATNVVIADKLGVSEGAVSNYMKDRATLPIVIKVAELTGCSVDWLLTGEKPTNQNVSFDVILDRKIREIVDEVLAEKKIESNVGNKTHDIAQELSTQSKQKMLFAKDTDKTQKKAG